MRERRAKVCAVDAAVAVRFRRVDVLAPWTVELDGFLVGYVGKTDGEQWLGVAVDSGTTAEVGFAVFLELHSESASRHGLLQYSVGAYHLA